MQVRSRKIRAGFSFTEVMFAVIILGVGFIMIAAVFPVAIQETKGTTEESAAAAVARGARDVLKRMNEATINNQIYVTPVANFALRTDRLLPSTECYTNPPAASLRTWTDLTAAEIRTVPGLLVSMRDPRFNVEMRSAMWGAIGANAILASDTRYAWTAFYRRDRTYINTTNTPGTPLIRDGLKPEGTKVVNSPAVTAVDSNAQVIILVTQIRNRPTYDATKDVTTVDSSISTLEPKAVNVTLIYGTPSTITLRSMSIGDGTMIFKWGSQDAYKAAAEGAYVLISDGNDATGAFAAGRIYRLGNFIGPNGGGVSYELLPGSDLSNANENLNNASAFIVGRSLTDPAAGYTTGTNDYEGPAQDVTVYTTYLP